MLLVKNMFSNAKCGSSFVNTVNELDTNGDSDMEFFAASYVGKKGPVIYAKAENSPGTLTERQQECNATYIYERLIARGFTKRAACGVLGNIQKECGVNPGVWQVLNDPSYGYGLFQWTSAKNKYLSWAVENNIINAQDSDYKLALAVMKIQVIRKPCFKKDRRMHKTGMHISVASKDCKVSYGTGYRRPFPGFDKALKLKNFNLKSIVLYQILQIHAR